MNTSTAMMLLPIAVSIVVVIQNSVDGLDEQAKKDFQSAMLLGVAYAASIGGMATIIGTAPNVVMVAYMLERYGTEIDFASWMMVGLPLSIVMLPIAWVLLTRFVFKVNFKTSYEGRALLRQMKDDLGPITVPEKRVAIIVFTLALSWILRPLLTKLPGLEALDDSSIAMAGGIALFLLPSGDKEDPMLIRWNYIEKLPWAVLLLFGGGLTLATAVDDTNLAKWLGSNLHEVGMLPLALLVLIIAAMIIFLTELTSNVATTLTFMPVVGAIALEAGYDPIVLLVPVTLAASCAFMLPVATPPNAIVFGSGLLTIPEMVRAGIVLNLISIFVVSLAALFLAPIFL
ncbi:DASS family sodium-coupled anion symporter [Woeseiaceae bacterium]|nr:DASS family sodium-coupled anion symporter [Woeseiaceae bacterium]